MKLVYAILTAITAQFFIYAGLTFMAGRLFPDSLARIYNLLPAPSHRLVLCTITIMLAGNYFFQKLYHSQPVLVAGIISTVCGILIVTVGGLIIEQKFPNILMALGIIMLITGAVICVYARSYA